MSVRDEAERTIGQLKGSGSVPQELVWTPQKTLPNGDYSATLVLVGLTQLVESSPVRWSQGPQSSKLTKTKAPRLSVNGQPMHLSKGRFGGSVPSKVGQSLVVDVSDNRGRWLILLPHQASQRLDTPPPTTDGTPPGPLGRSVLPSGTLGENSGSVARWLGEETRCRGRLGNRCLP